MNLFKTILVKLGLVIAGFILGAAVGIWFVIIGLILTPILIGIPIVIAGLLAPFFGPFILLGIIKLEEIKKRTVKRND